MKKFRGRRGRGFDVALQAAAPHQTILTSGMASLMAASSSSTSSLQKISYKLHPNEKAGGLASSLPAREGAGEGHRKQRDPARAAGGRQLPYNAGARHSLPSPPFSLPRALRGPKQSRTLWSRHSEGTRSVLQHAGGTSQGHRLPSGAIPREPAVTAPSPQPPSPHLPGAARASLTRAAARCSWDPSGFHRAS